MILSNLAPVNYRRSIFACEELLHQYSSDAKPRADISYLTGMSQAYGPYHYTRPTIINDLTLTKDEIYKGFSATTRNEINQIEKNDLCVHKMVSEPTEADLTLLDAQYSPFAEAFNIEPIDIKYLRALIAAKRLNLSYIYDQSNNIAVGHVYRMSELRPELFMSFREMVAGDDKERMKFVSKTNRYSHYCDMLYFKSLGFKNYDFGGYYDGGTDKKQMHINDFKLSFGGKTEMLYNSILYNSLLAKAYIKIKGNPFAATNAS